MWAGIVAMIVGARTVGRAPSGIVQCGAEGTAEKNHGLHFRRVRRFQHITVDGIAGSQIQGADRCRRPQSAAGAHRAPAEVLPSGGGLIAAARPLRSAWREPRSWRPVECRNRCRTRWRRKLFASDLVRQRYQRQRSCSAVASRARGDRQRVGGRFCDDGAAITSYADGAARTVCRSRSSADGRRARCFGMRMGAHSTISAAGRKDDDSVDRRVEGGDRVSSAHHERRRLPGADFRRGRSSTSAGSGKDP